MRRMIQGRRVSTTRQAAAEIMERRLLMSTYTVNTLSDAFTPAGGQLSLREAVADANADTQADTINFDPTLFTTGIGQVVVLLNGPISFTNTVAPTTLTGPGSAELLVDGDQTSRVFQISSGATVSISGLTVTDGAVNTSAGVAATGGGIQNAGVLSLTNVTVSNNSATGGSNQSTPIVGGAAYGAGIYSSGVLSLTTSSVSDNNATGGGSQYSYGGNASGGGIYSTGSLTITGSSVLGNNATGGDGDNSDNGGIGDQSTGGDALGGGIFSSGQTVLNSSDVSSNAADGGYDEVAGAGDGGGIYLTGIATFTGDSVNENQAVGGYDPSGNGGFSGDASGGGVYSTAALSISSSTLTGNKVTGGTGAYQDYSPAGNASGGAIAAQGNLTISNSTISGNLAEGGAPGGGYGAPTPGAQASGGGIYAAQQLVVTDCTVSLNTAQGANGGRVKPEDGGLGQGGGIATLGVGTISGTEITGNVANGGVGTTQYESIDSTVLNSGDGEGGGVYNDGVLTVVESTLSGNQATGGVGAVPSGNFDGNEYAGTGGDGLGAGVFSSSTLTVEDSTITANTASGGDGGENNGGANNWNGGNGGNGEGGGIYCSPALTVYDSTIVGNTATEGMGTPLYSNNGFSGTTNGSSGVAQGGGIYAGKNSLLDNSILSANNAASGADVYSSLSAASAFNLIGYGAPLTNGVNGNQIGVNDPMLSTLGNNGGPTQTMLPLAGSPVIDAGSNALIPAGVETDQRGEGYPRIVNGTVDLGAVEYVNPVTATPSITVTPAADQSVVVGQDHSFSLGTFAESNATGPFSATVDWGDGSTDTVISFITAAGNIPAQSHTFASIGNDTVTVSVTDSAGDASSPGSFAVTVNPAALSSTPVGSTPVGSTPVITSTTSLTASPVLSASGTQVRLTCSVTGGSSTPTGTVTFSLNGSAIGTDDLSSGFATLTTDVLAAGSDAFTASYGGDTNYSPSSSAAVSVVIPSPSPVSVALSKAVVPSTNVAGQKFNAKLPLLLTNSAATVKGVFTINYYVNSVARINGAKTLIGSVTKRLTIKAGKSVVVTNAIKALPASLPAGSYYLLAEMTDPSGLVNVTATAGTVTVAAPVVRLAATVGSVMPQTILIGRSGLIAVTITNNGNIAAIGKLVISVNPSTDGSTALPIVLAVYDVKTSILAGKTKTIKLRMKVSTTLGAGSYLPVASIALAGEQVTVIGSSGFDAG